MSQWRRTIEDFLAEHFGPFDSIGLAQSLVGTGVVQASRVRELVTFLEDAFGIDVEADDLRPANLDSIQGMLGFISRKLSRYANA